MRPRPIGHRTRQSIGVGNVTTSVVKRQELVTRANKQHEIVKKLRVELEHNLMTEGEVLNLLLKTRQLIDLSEEPNRYLSVRSFCDWALHVKMDRAGASLFLQEIDKAMEQTTDPSRLADLIGTRLSMDVFREDLIHLLIDYRLPADPIRTMPGWRSFLPVYLDLVAHCPVVDNKVQLRHIDRLTVGIDRTPPTHIPRGTQFACTIQSTFFKNAAVVLEWHNNVFYPTSYKPGRFYQW